MRTSILLSLGPILWASAATAVVLVDNQGGGDVLTIQDGIDLATTLGDPVVDIRGGVQYSGPGNYDLTFGDETLTVRTEPGGPTAVIDPQFAGDGFRFPVGDINQSIVENLIIRHAVRGVHCSGNNHAEPTIRGCVIEDCTAFGIYSDHGSRPLTVEDCILRRNESGIQVFDGPVTDCEIYENANQGMVVIESSNSLIRFCNVYGNGGTGVVVFPSTAALQDCNVLENGGSGISMTTGQGLLRCRVSGNQGWGFSFGGWTGVSTTASDCQVTGNGAGGIRVLGQSGLALTGCTVMDNGGIGAWTEEGWIQINRSILWGNCGNQAQNDGGSQFSELSVACSIFNAGGIVGGSFAPTNSNSDPMVCRSVGCGQVPFAGGDYGLLSGSPALPANSPCGALIGALDEGCSPASAPLEGGGDESRFVSIGIAPNPAHGEASVRFTLKRAGLVRLDLIDVAGRRLETLLHEPMPQGETEVRWSPSRLPAGATGVFFLRLSDGQRILGNGKFTVLD